MPPKPKFTRQEVAAVAFAMIKEGGVAAVPGSCFGGEGFIRLSYCYGDEELATGLDRMAAFIQRLQAD